MWFVFRVKILVLGSVGPKKSIACMHAKLRFSLPSMDSKACLESFLHNCTDEAASRMFSSRSDP